MSLIQIVVLALIQGITEFLPISSSGHLILAPVIMGWKDQGVITDMVTNLGSWMAVVIYFWRDVMAMFRGLGDAVRRRTTYNSNLMFNVVIATIPILIVGLLLKITHLDDKIRLAWLVAVNAIVFGLILYLCDTYGLMKRGINDLNWKSSLIMGVFQSLALSPGTSRSGITMSAGRGLGMTRPEAARFSFLMSIPANGAASALIIGDALKSGIPITFDVILCGVLTFFISLGTIAFLMRMLRTMSFLPFVAYRVLLGGALLGLIAAGVPLVAPN
jgi:undecaprenyl-diphosphatase